MLVNCAKQISLLTKEIQWCLLPRPQYLCLTSDTKAFACCAFILFPITIWISRKSQTSKDIVIFQN